MNSTLEIKPINEFVDAVIVTNPKEKFEGIDLESPKGIAVIFDAQKVTQKDANILRKRLINKLKDANSPRVHALDWACTFAGEGQPYIPVQMIISNLRAEYLENALIASQAQGQQDAHS